MRINFKLAVKNLLKSKTSTLLNSIGIFTASTAFIIIMLYVWTELHFDGYHKHATELYRLELKVSNKDKSSVYLAGQTATTLVSEIPEILDYSTYMPWGKWGKKTFTSLNASGNKVSTMEDYAFSDSHLTSLFSFDFVDKTDSNPLENPNTAMVSADFARKIWGNTQVAGKTFEMNEQTYTVNGVFKTLPVNTIFTAPIILKMPEKGWLAKAFYNWGVTNYPQFILVKKGTNAEVLNRKINEQSSLRKKYDYYEKNDIKLAVIARPVKDLRFTEDTAESPLFNTNSKTTVLAIGFVGVLILLIALINYLNFSIALIPKRIKNVCISRIMGSSMKNIFATAALESGMLFLISMLGALLLFYWLNNNYMSELIGYDFPIVSYWKLIVVASLFIVILGLATGVFPAVKSLTIKPSEGVKAYKNKTTVQRKGILSIVQFTFTIALIAISTLIIKQIHFMKNTDVGFNKDAVLFMPIDGDFKAKAKSFGEVLKASPYVKDIGFSIRVPGVISNTNSYKFNEKSVSAWTNIVDADYMKMMDFKIVEGRAFIADSKAERGNLICNEAAAKMFAWKVGDLITHHGLKKPTPLVGIVKDFNYSALRNPIEPYVFTCFPSTSALSNISIKLNGKNTAQTLAFIRKTYNDLGITQAFQYQFLDEHMNMQYAGENRQAKIIIIFSLVSLIISILGMLGLSIFAAQGRTKEIGIRKINGATIKEILVLLNSSFVKWVVLAFIVATPIAYYAMNKWLENFAYKTTLSWWIFALAGLSALVIALLTVSWQSWLAASRNPVDALRYE